MPKLFKNNTTESAKDYIERKRNKRLYCDTANNNTEGRYLATFNDNTKRLQSAINHSNLLKLTKGMLQHRHDKFVDCYHHMNERKTQQYNIKKTINNCHTDNTIKNINFKNEMNIMNETKYSKGVEYSSVKSSNIEELKKDIKTSKVEKHYYPMARLLKYKH